MTDDPNKTPAGPAAREGEPVHLDGAQSLLGLFEKLSFRQRIAKIRHGLRQPKDSGEYKWAVVECQRFASPVAAVVVPSLVVLALAVFGTMTSTESRNIEVTVQESVKPPDLQDIKEIVEQPPDLPDPVDVEFNPDVVSDNPSPAPPTDFSPQPVEVTAVAITKSVVMLPGVYANRNPGNQGSALAAHNAGFTDIAVMRALRWLKTKQEPDGSWKETRPAMTALAILAYLAHGDTPTSSPEFGDTVKRAIQYLAGSLDADSRFKGRDEHDYTQPIGAYALAEAYGMIRRPDIRDAAERAIAVVIKGQNRDGAFNYNLIGPKDTRNDTTYTSWCVQALKAAKMAGLSNEGLDAAMKKAVVGVKKNYGERGGDGGFGYTGPGGYGLGLSGAGVPCLQFLGDTKSKEYSGAMAGLANMTCDWLKPEGESPVYYWYYTTQAKFQHGGDTWSAWNKIFSPTLVKNQQVTEKEKSNYKDHKGEPRAIGFWKSPAKSEITGGNSPIMDTILCTLMLEVYYRYLPTFKTEETGKVDLNAGDQNINISIRL